jgi:transmembrane sensor
MSNEQINNEADALLERANALGRDIRKIEAVDMDQAYRQTMEKISRNNRHLFMRRLTRYAAILTLPLLLATLYLGYVHFYKPSFGTVRYAEVNVAAGSVIRYELPDNSIVWLNAGSKLRYPTKFDKDRRIVDLQGEGYFEVTANKKSPFYVRTPSGMKVFVYGTKFDVNAYSDDTFEETILERGHVNAISPDEKTMYKLNPGECIHFDKQTKTFKMRDVDVEELTAWKDGKLMFRDTSLEEVLKRLSRHFNVDIQLNNHLNKEYEYRATFRNETLTQILDYLSKSVSMKWRSVDKPQNSDGTYEKHQVIVDLY